MDPVTDAQSSHLESVPPVGAQRAPITDLVEGLWFTRLVLLGKNPDERTWALGEAKRLLGASPPSGSRDDGLHAIEAARAGDADARQQLGDSLLHVRWMLERARDAAPLAEPATAAKKPRRQRKPSLARLAAKAKQLGVAVTIESTGAVTLRADSGSTAPVDSPEAELQKWKAKRHAH
jgi:hypothetical protein